MTRFTFNLLSPLFLCVSLVLVSCRGDIGENLDITSEDVAEIVEVALDQMEDQLTELSSDLEDLTLEELCDSVYTNQLAFSRSNGPRQGSLDLSWTFDLVCGGTFELPQSANFDFNSAGNYSTPRLVSEDSTQFAGEVAGLQIQASDYLWGGDVVRSGREDLTINGQTATLTTDMDLTVVDVTIPKQSSEISSGSGTFSITVDQNGTITTYSGTITLHGGGSATIVVNGNTYDISI
jgi:hypothetical protein